MSRIRHWKQHWDPTADLVFAKRFKLGLDPKKPFVDENDPVDKTQFSLHRLKIWWRAGFLKLAEKPAQIIGTMYPTGRGWYAVTLPNGDVKKVRGKEKAEQLCMS